MSKIFNSIGNLNSIYFQTEASIKSSIKKSEESFRTGKLFRLVLDFLLPCKFKEFIVTKTIKKQN
jgi:hypothetical protein